MTKKIIGILCLSAIPDDPRVRRQGDLFFDAGYEVRAFGLPGYSSPMPRWIYRMIDAPQNGPVRVTTSTDAVAVTTVPVSRFVKRRIPLRGIARTVLKLPHRALRWLIGPLRRPMNRIRRVFDLAKVNLYPPAALSSFWSLNDKFEKLYQLASTEKVDVWLANDWTTLPIAMRLSREQGVPFIYDTHELAVDEYAQSLKWRLTQRPIIAGVESAGIHAATFTTCVSSGISARLKDVHGLSAAPTVVRNTPLYSQSSFRPTGEQIRVLYHGIVAPGRALEEAIESVSSWRPEFSFSIRGPSDRNYLQHLRNLAAQSGVTNRIEFLPPVAMTDLVAGASEFDVGFFAIRDHSLQNTYVLPNKFFEYTMAGLALCVSDLPEMRKLIEEFGIGSLIRNVEPVAIAEAINALDASRIDSFKRHAIEAAKHLCWETESRILVEMAEKAVSQHH